jgi:uncharacterized protein YeaO (DUF488 family)
VAQEKVRIKRAYVPASNDDGYRVFVDRLWPRGIAKQDLKFDRWDKDLAPSPALRKWFGHKMENWDDFRESSENELRQPEQQARMSELIKMADRGPMTLVYAAKDEEHNHARVLAAELMRLY